MHADEVYTDVELVRRLLAAQFPQWADLPIKPVASHGTDNALYRLGEDMLVRLPRIHWAVGQVQKEQRWLPQLAPQLPLAIPTPVAMGTPGDGYPWSWSIYRWLEGERITDNQLADPEVAANQLAEFIIALHDIDSAGGPPPGEHNSGRGVPLADRDARVRAAIDSLEGLVDAAAVTKAWEAALNVTKWTRPPVWVHGDIQAGNLLCSDGRLSAVIDFGCLGVGDPAVDMIVAWNLFSGSTREVFRGAVSVDDATWTRGKGWALSAALIALPYYLHTNPAIVRSSWRTIDELLSDQ